MVLKQPIGVAGMITPVRKQTILFSMWYKCESILQQGMRDKICSNQMTNKSIDKKIGSMFHIQLLKIVCRERGGVNVVV